MSNILPFRQSDTPPRLTRVNVSRCTIYNAFVLSMFRAGWRLEKVGNMVWMVSP